MARGGVESRVNTQLLAAPSASVARRLGRMARGTGQVRYSQWGRGQCMALYSRLWGACVMGGRGDEWRLELAKKSRLWNLWPCQPRPAR